MKSKVNSIYKLLLTTALMAGFLLGAQVAMAAGYHEYANPPCYDITGQTTAVWIGGVNNGGIMNFDDAGVDPKYQACVRMSAAGPGAVPARLEGWVWNDNLGWVSMYCPATGMNLGIACGGQQYSVLFATAGVGPDFSSVSMSGNAWGDNIGYISFKDVTSGSTWNWMKPVSSGASRGLISSATQSDIHAWADSVGWLNFTGVKFRWESVPVVPQPHDVKIWDPTVACNLATGCVPTVAQTPVADGGQNYTIEIPFKYGAVDLTPVEVTDCGADSISMYATGVSAFCARIKLEWQDNVDYNQTLKANQNGATNPYNLTSAPVGVGAVIKPLLYSLAGPDFTYSGIKKIWGANVKSFAPTSDGNVVDGMQLEKFNYVDTSKFLDPTYNPTKIDQDRLKLAKVNLMLFKYSPDGIAPGECVMGDIKDPSPITPPNPYTCNLRTYIQDVNMSFRPLFEITKLVHKIGTKELNFINIDNVEELQRFDYVQTKNSAAVISGNPVTRLVVGLANEFNYVLQFEPGESEVSWNTETASGSYVGKVTSATPGASFSSDAQPYLFSMINYRMAAAPQWIQYYANKLPRISAGILKNPVAKVQGNVYLTDYAAKTSDVSLRSLGNISSNLRREEIVRNVNKYLRGYTAALVTEDKTVNTGTVANINNLNELVQDKVFYLKGYNLKIDCGATCVFDRNVTFIVENGNIIVNSDIVPAAGVQVGMIALRNLEGNVKTQGFLYLDKDVKLLSRVQVYLDRVLQSYDKTGAGGFDTNGFFKTSGNDSARQALFKDQLVLEGTISSMNGIGNASANPATDEEGKNIGSLAGSACADYSVATLAGICRARVTDLNYLRYYGPGLEICTGLEGGVGALPNVPRDQQLRSDGPSGMGCNPSAPGYAIDASTLYDEQSTWGDLISGGSAGGLPSPYFSGKPASFANQFPVNFFYVPISNDLAGFEQDQEYNPVIQ